MRIGVVGALGFLAIALARCRSWWGVRAALRAGTPVELPVAIPALLTPGAEEPGIVGFLRPVLVLPAQLLEHLNPEQLGAILTHELCHVRRRDNLFAAVHMVVEAIFWFHPLVWWIGSRMVDERELACDEEVLRMGCDPADYVEGILTVCRFYTESPLPCISGVTGADVKKRLRAILAGSIAPELNGAKKMALATNRRGSRGACPDRRAERASDPRSGRTGVYAEMGSSLGQALQCSGHAVRWRARGRRRARQARTQEGCDWNAKRWTPSSAWLTFGSRTARDQVAGERQDLFHRGSSIN